MENYEFWATIATVVLAAIAVATFVTHGQNNLRNELRSEIRELTTRVSSLEQRVTRLEGLFEDMRAHFRRGETTKEDQP